MKTDNLAVILLHEYPEYLDASATLLNSQWKRSFSARAHSLSRSCKDLPDSLLLLEKQPDGSKIVIGHSRLTRVLEDDNGCWIESVVIAENRRNKGYGRYLMSKTEEYAKKLNFCTAYLSTHDQQGFYECLGYIYCEPVSSISFQRIGLMKYPTSSVVKHNIENTHQTIQEIHQKEINVFPTLPPPPPPPPPILRTHPTCMKSTLEKYWMKKSL
ncbi:n-alpha-acetyltransferase 80 [Trichonephila clavata]|uniref:N-alpha-acetyltransferase 80 n=1 Tax=Trichonephila clavata TaxID=2740835 RepID=A0A8X6IIR1_TRICU|nr:n-alpha-acetyltransferase 80 [Trichonephila clavata]